MIVPTASCLIILSVVSVNWALEVRRFTINLERGSSVNLRLLSNCSRASLISVDPQMEVRFEGDCSSDVVRIIHLGFNQPTEHVHEFALETPKKVSLVSLKVVVKENLKFSSLLKKNRSGVPALSANQTLADILNLSDRCRARIRRVPKQAPLTGLCDDPHLWSDCENIGDLQTRSTVEDSLVVTLISDGSEVNVGILINPGEQNPGISFDANLRVEIVPRLLIAIQRTVLSSAGDDSTIFHVVQQVSSCSFVKVFSRTVVSQFTQRSLDRLEIGLYCRKDFKGASVTLLALNPSGSSFGPFSVTLLKSVNIDLSFKSLVIRQETESATLIVESSRDAELRIDKGLSRGILSIDSLPVVSFGTNVPLEYKPHADISYADELITDNLVVSYSNVEFIVTVLLLKIPPRAVDVTPSLSVSTGQHTIFSRKLFRRRFSNFGNVHFELLKTSSRADELFARGHKSRRFSIYDVDDASVSFRAPDVSDSRTMLEFLARFAGSNAIRLTCELSVLKFREDSKPPVQSDCSLQLTVHPRSTRVVVERATLSFVDERERDEHNEYKGCTSGVYFIFDARNTRGNGHFGFANGEQIARFSQSDVNRGNIFYYAPSIFSRMNARKIPFEFRAVDMHGNSGPTLKLQVYLKPLKISETLHNEIAFDEGGPVLGSNILSPAVNSSSTVFGIVSLPSLGKISIRRNALSARELGLWDNFSYSELTSHNVWYETDRHDFESDIFELLAVNSKDHIVRKRKAHKRAKQRRQRKFRRNAMQYIRIIVKITSADQMTGTEGGKDRLKFNITVHEGRKSSISIQGLDFTLIEAPRDGHVYIARGANPKTQMITYVHSGSEIGVDTGMDNFVLQNPSGEAEVNVLVLPVDNAAPVINVGDATIVLEGESSLVNWDVADDDSKVFWCHVPEAPVFGQLTIRTHKFTEFNNSESRSVVYEQLKHARVEPSEDHFKIRCSDGVNLSPLKQVQIVIKGQNDEAPHLAVDGVTVLEGREAPVKIHASDLDSPRSDLRFRVNKSPRRGLIAILSADGHNEAVIDFPEESLSRVVYVHDGSESLKDSFELTVSDGRHSTKQVVDIKVLAVDDEPPELVVNRGIRVEVGTSAVIDARHLQVDDIDSTPDTIYFEIVEGPRNGILLVGADKNHSVASSASFRLDDVKLQNVVYAHRSKICCRSDSFTFRITDGFNETPLHEFNITVHLPENFVPQVNSTHWIRLQHRLHLSKHLFDISGVQWFAVTKPPSNGNLSFENETLGFTIGAALTSDSTEDTFGIVLRNGSSLEEATFNIEWCVLSLLETLPEMVPGKTFSIGLKRKGCNTTAEGILRSSVGEFPFLIPASISEKCLALSIPEEFVGEFSIELTGVRGCLIDPVRHRFQTVVLPPMHYLHFERQEYSVEEPKEDELVEILFVRVARGGTTARRTKIDFKIITVAGTAREIEDFNPIDKVFSLKGEEDGLTVAVEILGESRMENSRFFTILLEPVKDGLQFKPSKTVVRINDARALPSFTEYPVIFALDPKTGESLTHSRLLPRGTSLYCATECDILNPRYTGLCSTFNSSRQIHYQWKTSTNGRLKSIKNRSFILKTNRKILESSLYLLPGSTVVCSAKIATADNEGSEINSEPYLISSEPSSTSCPGSVGSTPFSSKLRVALSPNSSSEIVFALTVILPHHDGSWPFWSTRPIHVADTEKQLYASKHRCSNLFWNNSVMTLEPNVTSCTWNYELTYSMSELLSCGAQVDETDDDDVSSVSLLLPIHVMYIVHQSSKRWHHVSLSNELRVSFVYKSRVIGGGHLEPHDSTNLSAILQIQQSSLDKNGSLVVVFETDTNFDGLLAADPINFNESIIEVHEHSSSESASLFRVRNDGNISKRKSRWTFSSLVSHSLYANNFSLSFLPCVGDAADCKLVEDKPITLILPVHIQPGQTSSQNYRLESQLLLTGKQHWMKDNPESDNIIQEGEAVYGAVRVFNPDLPDQVLITRIQRCYICREVPQTPRNQTSQCPYKVIDAESTISTRKEFRGLLASKNSGAFTSDELTILEKENADGFIFDSAPLFEREKEDVRWRVHCVFVVGFGQTRVRRHATHEKLSEGSSRTLETSAQLRLRRSMSEPMSLTVAHPNYISVTFLFLSLGLLLLVGCWRRKPRDYHVVPPADMRHSDSNTQSLL